MTRSRSSSYLTLRRVLMTLVTMGLLLSWASVTEATPSFARKYQTSCQTCHIAFPKLNPFGEAFRLRGYRMPDETEDMIKELPVALGAPAYKRLFPDTVWPSTIPGGVPLAFDSLLSSHSSSTEEEDGSTHTIANDFRFPEEVGLVTSGTLGDTLSFFGEIGFAQEVENGQVGFEVEMEHAQLNFNGPFGSGTAFNLRVGRFAPEVTQAFSHGHLLTASGPAALMQYQPIGERGGRGVGGHHGGGGISLPHSVDGIEAYGILNSRFLYSGGLANGLGPGPETIDGNSAKDVFGRVAYKIGGLPYDGSGYVPSDKNWREMSVALGAFAYRGDGTDILLPAGDHGDEFLMDESFTRAGFDVNMFVRDLNVVAGFVRGRDRLATFALAHDDEPSEDDHGDEPSEDDQGDEPADDDHGDAPPELVLEDQGNFTYEAWFVQADYVVLPWLHCAVRYEWLDPANGDAPVFKRVVPNVTALIRANVKAYLEFQRNLGENSDYSIAAALRFAF